MSNPYTNRLFVSLGELAPRFPPGSTTVARGFPGISVRLYPSNCQPLTKEEIRRIEYSTIIEGKRYIGWYHEMVYHYLWRIDGPCQHRGMIELLPVQKRACLLLLNIDPLEAADRFRAKVFLYLRFAVDNLQAILRVSLVPCQTKTPEKSPSPSPVGSPTL